MKQSLYYNMYHLELSPFNTKEAKGLLASKTLANQKCDFDTVKANRYV